MEYEVFAGVEGESVLVPPSLQADDLMEAVIVAADGVLMQDVLSPVSFFTVWDKRFVSMMGSTELDRLPYVVMTAGEKRRPDDSHGMDMAGRIGEIWKIEHHVLLGNNASPRDRKMKQQVVEQAVLDAGDKLILVWSPVYALFIQPICPLECEPEIRSLLASLNLTS
jgi:hypothetical protein